MSKKKQKVVKGWLTMVDKNHIGMTKQRMGESCEWIYIVHKTKAAATRELKSWDSDDEIVPCKIIYKI